MFNADQTNLLSEYVERAEAAEKALTAARKTIENLDIVLHKAARIAAHIPYLCNQIEGTDPILHCAAELQTLLTARQP